jgi:ubiquinone/menaquinone biosynthesis C-methylase UbiE
MATILMRLTEGRASRQYNRWIGLLTLWQDGAMRNYIIDKVLPKRGRILDIGCGTGKLLIEAGRRGFKGVGIDMNQSMIEVAEEESKRRNLSHRLRFEIGNALELNLSEEKFDVVVSTLMISELQQAELEQFIREASKHVKPEGLLVVGGEGEPDNFLFDLFLGFIRRVSYWFVSRLTGLAPHPYHQVAIAMKKSGLDVRYQVRFLSGFLTLYVGKVK